MIFLGLLAGTAAWLGLMFNVRFTQHHGNRWHTTFLNFLLGAICTGAVFLFSHPGGLASGPWWSYLGGLVGIGFVIAGVIFTPKLGGTGWLVASVLGQVIMSQVLDRLVLNRHLSWHQILSGLLLIVAMWLLMEKKNGTSDRAN
ncbi:DMT family transporter [Deinococcus roseus]|uniref:EamA-like transporter family protein n=1 Tax=Deinococcus roseus TaxID=392414 RepID=A0ABQ2D1P6_9DEIO|nr:DMT family transporter [Deinococcus roseus]GGJ38012.1 hypothetical protein GCM10008938_25160 [Deinococcus roseus]